MEINIICDTIAQFKVLRHLQANFIPEGVKKLELVKDGIRLTDKTGASANFIYENGEVVLHE